MTAAEQTRQERLIISLSLIAGAVVAAVLLGGALIQRDLLVDLAAERGLAQAAAIEARFDRFDAILGGRATDRQAWIIGDELAAAGAVDFALADADGRTVVAAFAADLGTVDAGPAFADFGRAGETLIWIEDRRGWTIGPRMLATVHVPYVAGDRFVGALRMDLDIGEEARMLENRVTDIQTGIIALWVLLSGLAGRALIGRRPSLAPAHPARGFGA